MVSAGDAWRRLADLQREAKDSEGLVRTLADLARIADRAGNMRQAVSLYSDAIREAPSSASPSVTALLHVRRSQAFLRLGELASSFEDLDIAERALHGSDDAKAGAETYGALSNFYSRLGERLRARIAAEHAMDLIESEPGQSGLDPREASQFGTGDAGQLPARGG
jgi:tetratricopeptide (TPR) repeat protein